MKTINDVLYFLNKLDYVGCVERDGYEQFNCVKKVLLDHFWDFNSQKNRHVI